jgi:hypothetical protein
MMRLGVDAKTDEAEQAAAVTITVVGEIIRTVLTPSAPVVAATISSASARKLGSVLRPARVTVGDKGVAEGTIPPKLDVIVGNKGLNWRPPWWSSTTTPGGRFGKGVGVLRMMMDGVDTGVLMVAMVENGPLRDELRAMVLVKSPGALGSMDGEIAPR